MLLDMLTPRNMIEMEAFAVAAAVAVAFTLPRLGERWFEAAERHLAGLARRKRWAIFAAASLVLLLRLALLPMLPVRQPQVRDEFSYLLAAGTFASGRLSNPPHPMRVHLESAYVNQFPAYVSKYPPAQGLALAAGQLAAGHPWAGVWFSVGLMCAALTWMLQGWLPPGWALLGGVLAGLRYGLFSYWMNSYWGGAVAAAGGALVLGALPRIFRRPRAVHALWMGLGLCVLANSRPYEGLVLCIPAGAALAAWLLRQRIVPVRRALTRVALPLILAAGAGLGWMAYYNWRGAGDPWRHPYVVHEQTYGAAPLFIPEPPRPAAAELRHKEMRDLFDRLALVHREARTSEGFRLATRDKVEYFFGFYLGPALALPLVFLPWVLRDRRIRLLLVAGLCLAAALVLEVFGFPHYAAPAAGLIVAVILQCMRHMRQCAAGGRRMGLALARALPLVCFAMAAVRIAAGPMNISMDVEWAAAWCHTGPGDLDRAAVLARLEKHPGRHLVLVRYGASHDPHRGWVYNGADIDGARVVWAHDMGPRDNAELLAYFRGRHVWVAEPDASPPALSPYESGGSR